MAAPALISAFSIISECSVIVQNRGGELVMKRTSNGGYWRMNGGVDYLVRSCPLGFGQLREGVPITLTIIWRAFPVSVVLDPVLCVAFVNCFGWSIGPAELGSVSRSRTAGQMQHMPVLFLAMKLSTVPSSVPYSIRQAFRRRSYVETEEMDIALPKGID